jgi:alpha-tubulin suppressor-like RCC1 family protein
MCQIDPNMVSSNDVSFEGLCDAAQRLNDSVRTVDTRNMLVCLKDELPPLKLISSGAYHALLLSEENMMFVWGMGRIGRLGFGNELDQKVPVALEAEVTDVGDVVLEPDDDGFEVMIRWDE